MPSTVEATVFGSALGLGGWGASEQHQCIMGKASVPSGQAGDSDLLTTPSSDPHTPSTFLQCPPLHKWVPRHPETSLSLFLV